MTPKNDPPLRNIALQLPADLDDALRAKCKQEDRPVSRVVRAALREYLREYLGASKP